MNHNLISTLSFTSVNVPQNLTNGDFSIVTGSATEPPPWSLQRPKLIFARGGLSGAMLSSYGGTSLSAPLCHSMIYLGTAKSEEAD